MDVKQQIISHCHWWMSLCLPVGRCQSTRRILKILMYLYVRCISLVTSNRWHKCHGYVWCTQNNLHTKNNSLQAEANFSSKDFFITTMHHGNRGKVGWGVHNFAYKKVWEPLIIFFSQSKVKPPEWITFWDENRSIRMSDKWIKESTEQSNEKVSWVAALHVTHVSVCVYAWVFIHLCIHVCRHPSQPPIKNMASFTAPAGTKALTKGSPLHQKRDATLW
jgi:hypothetical protein